MSNPGARRVVTSDSRRAPRRWLNLSRVRRWRANLGPALGGVLAAVQAVFITYLTIIVPAIATYVATSGNPDLAHTAWFDSLRVGTDIWLLGHGGATILDAAAVTAIPLGIAILVLLATSGTFRRTITPSASTWLTAVISYPIAVVFIGSLFASSAGRASLWRAGLGALVLALIGVTTGLARHDGGPKWEAVKPAWFEKIPSQVVLSLRGGVLGVCALLVGAGALAAVWVFQGQGEIGDVLVGVGGDWLSIFILGVAQLLAAPNLVLWTFAWLTGAGFSVGEGTVWAADAVVSGPLPAFPILGALPQPDSLQIGIWVYLVPLAAGVLAAIPLVRRHRDLRWIWSGASALIIAFTAAVGSFILALIGSGSLGPGRMAHIGPHAGSVFLHVLVPVVIAALLTVFICGQHARDAWSWARGKVSPQTGDQTGLKPDQSSAVSSDHPQTQSHTAPAPKP